MTNTGLEKHYLPPGTDQLDHRQKNLSCRQSDLSYIVGTFGWLGTLLSCCFMEQMKQEIINLNITPLVVSDVDTTENVWIANRWFETAIKVCFALQRDNSGHVILCKNGGEGREWERIYLLLYKLTLSLYMRFLHRGIQQFLLPYRTFFRFAIINIYTDLKNVSPLRIPWLWGMLPISQGAFSGKE